MQGPNPSPIPADTDPEVWRMQMAATGRRSVASRLDEMAELSAHGARMEADAVRRRHPDYGDEQVFLALVRRRYGDALDFEAWPDATEVEP